MKPSTNRRNLKKTSFKEKNLVPNHHRLLFLLYCISLSNADSSRYKYPRARGDPRFEIRKYRPEEISAPSRANIIFKMIKATTPEPISASIFSTSI